MKKTNELNKFLSYIHMGNNIFRIYGDQAIKLNDEKLVKLINEIMEIFKTHEEAISKLIIKEGEKPTERISFVGKMGICKEKMKRVKNSFDICTNAIEAMYMGIISSFKFLDENHELINGIKKQITKVIDDYGAVIDKIKEYLLNQYR